MSLVLACHGVCVDVEGMLAWARALSEREGEGLQPLGAARGGGAGGQGQGVALALHPAGEPLRLVLAADGTLTGWLSAASAGPGYHQFACEVLAQLKQRFAPDLLVRDDTGYFARRDRAELEAAVRAWRVQAGRRALATLRRTRHHVLFGLPEGSQAREPGAGPRILTALGAFDARSWERALAEVEAGRELHRHFAWWNPGKDAWYWRNLALAYLTVRHRAGEQARRRRLARAALAARTARGLDPEVPLPEAQLARAYEELGREAEALPHLRAACAAAPAHRELRHWLVRLLERLGRQAEAAAELENLAERRPRDSALAYEAAVRLIELDEHARALRLLERAARLAPRRARYQGELAVALAGLGRYHEALAALERALELDPHNPVGWGNRAALLEALGRHDEAAAARRRAAELGG
ncbi:MAG: hypothetical protein KatS3mg102_1455 [Planctomycetota bacterium]|nr:MAG: hypothetical protein KatS3mg102_1455 [Planctomycetota bacterium]